VVVGGGVAAVAVGLVEREVVVLCPPGVPFVACVAGGAPPAVLVDVVCVRLEMVWVRLLATLVAPAPQPAGRAKRHPSEIAIAALPKRRLSLPGRGSRQD